MVRTFQACETSVQTATVEGDNKDIFRITGAVNNDPVAAETRYHKACLATNISKNNLHYEGRQDTSYDAAFQKLCVCARVCARVRVFRCACVYSCAGVYACVRMYVYTGLYAYYIVSEIVLCMCVREIYLFVYALFMHKHV